MLSGIGWQKATDADPEENLESNIKDLVVKKEKCRPQPVRITYIPKDEGFLASSRS